MKSRFVIVDLELIPGKYGLRVRAGLCAKHLRERKKKGWKLIRNLGSRYADGCEDCS